MKIKTILLGAALAATIPMKAAQSYFVIFDSLLRVPALCYPLPPGWTGMGWVKWNVPARSNPYLQSTILMNPSERRIVQEAGFIGRGAFLLSQSGGIYSNPDAMAQHLARRQDRASDLFQPLDDQLASGHLDHERPDDRAA